MFAIASTDIDVTGREFIRLPAAPAAPPQRILAVEFRSPDGRSWNAIGGGDTVAAAIDWARESCPGGTTWQTVSWHDLHGD
jgi:xanthine/CO dehydrogenase XdhC/CoxF family maturation factor